MTVFGWTVRGRLENSPKHNKTLAKLQLGCLSDSSNWMVLFVIFVFDYLANFFEVYKES